MDSIREKRIEDPELGTIVMRHNPRAVRYILKVKGNEVIGTIPAGGKEETLLRFINESRTKLRELLTRRPVLLLNEQTSLRTLTFSVHVACRPQRGYTVSLNNEVLDLNCPMNTNFEDVEEQAMLQHLLECGLRHEAKRVLPNRLKSLAAKHNFIFKGVTIQNSKTRWGSCSSKQKINLSLHLMLLPTHLIDYVLLHELCHTVEMNHSIRFWELMDKVTDNKSEALREELKNHHTLK